MQQTKFTPDAITGPCPVSPAGRPRRAHQKQRLRNNPAQRPQTRVRQARIPQNTL